MFHLLMHICRHMLKFHLHACLGEKCMHVKLFLCMSAYIFAYMLKSITRKTRKIVSHGVGGWGVGDASGTRCLCGGEVHAKGSDPQVNFEFEYLGKLKDIFNGLSLFADG